MAKEVSFFVPNETIRLTREGVWLSNGAEITHGETLRAFARGLKKDSEGYYVQVGKDTKRVEVEDTPFFVMSLTGDPSRGFEVVLNDETREKLDPSTLAFQSGSTGQRLVCRVKKQFEAKFLHSAYYELLKHLEEDRTGYFLTLEKSRITLAKK